jgi:hypothetical protein
MLLCQACSRPLQLKLGSAPWTFHCRKCKSEYRYPLPVDIADWLTSSSRSCTPFAQSYLHFLTYSHLIEAITVGTTIHIEWLNATSRTIEFDEEKTWIWKVLDSDQCQFELNLRIFHGLDAETPYEFIAIHLDSSCCDDSELLLSPTTFYRNQWVDCRITRSVALGPDDETKADIETVHKTTLLPKKRAACVQGRWLVDQFVANADDLKKKAEGILAMQA